MGIDLIEDRDGSESEDPSMSQYYGSDADLRNASSLYRTQDVARLIEVSLEEDLPDNLKGKAWITEFWAVLGKTIKFTFIEKEDLLEFELLFENAKLDFIMSKPPYEFTFEDMKTLDELKIYFAAAVRRSIGFSTHKINERTLVASQISQVIRSNTESYGASGGGRGIFSKLKRMF